MAPSAIHRSILNETHSLFSPSHDRGDNINLIFGVLAVLASIITIWQGRRLWRSWNRRCSRSRGSSRYREPDLSMIDWLIIHHQVQQMRLARWCLASSFDLEKIDWLPLGQEGVGIVRRELVTSDICAIPACPQRSSWKPKSRRWDYRIRKSRTDN